MGNSTCVCLHCGRSFVPATSRTKLCSDECRRKHRCVQEGRAVIDRTARPCGYCGTVFAPRRFGPPAMWCSATCKGWASTERAREDGRYEVWAENSRARNRKQPLDHVCAQCGAAFVSIRTKPRNCGAPTCRRRQAAADQRELNARYMAEHGEWYSARYNRSERAKQRQRERAAEMPLRQRYAAAYKAYDAQRRALVKAATVEVFEPREIFDRDGWNCLICGAPVPPDVAWPHPLSASLDHLVPLSRGGSHSRSNTRCTHLTCNLAKGSSLEG